MSPARDEVIRVARSPRVWAVVGRQDTAVSRGPIAEHDIARADGLPPWRARELLAGRALLRGLLRAVAGDAAAAPVDPDERGRPVLTGWPRLGVSISHDGDLAAACVGVDTTVGIDIQAPADVTESLMRRCLGRHIGLLAGCSRAARIRAFTWVWTAQEACVKASGNGLADRPWTIDVRPGAASGSWRGYRWIALPGFCEVPLTCAYDSRGVAGNHAANARCPRPVDVRPVVRMAIDPAPPPGCRQPVPGMDPP